MNFTGFGLLLWASGLLQLCFITNYPNVQGLKAIVLYPHAPVSLPGWQNWIGAQLVDSAPCVFHPCSGIAVLMVIAEVQEGRWKHGRSLKAQAWNWLIAISAHVLSTKASPKASVEEIHVTHNEDLPNIGIQEGVNSWGQSIYGHQLLQKTQEFRLTQDGLIHIKEKAEILDIFKGLLRKPGWLFIFIMK